MGCGEVYLEIATLASGRTARLTATAFISGRMAIATREVGSIALSMDEALISLPTEIYTPATTSTEKLTARAYTSGRTAAFIRASLKKA